MKFEDCVFNSHPTGSRYICNPPVTDTDNDTVFLANGYHDWQTILRNDGWQDCGQEYETGGDFHAFRKGVENYIVTEDLKFYSSYVIATEAAKALNLLKKEDRIKLFQAVAQTVKEGKVYDDTFAIFEDFALGLIPPPAPAPVLNAGQPFDPLADAFNQFRVGWRNVPFGRDADGVEVLNL